VGALSSLLDRAMGGLRMDVDERATVMPMGGRGSHGLGDADGLRDEEKSV